MAVGIEFRYVESGPGEDFDAVGDAQSGQQPYPVLGIGEILEVGERLRKGLCIQ